jgi:predicted DNA-binding helix-hairpin-helix protein
MIYYKIRNKDTGLFVKDTELFVKGTPAYHSYNKDGRVFQTLGRLRSFLTNVMTNDQHYNKFHDEKRNRLSEWEIVELEMVVKDVKGIHEVIKADKLIKLL